MNDEGVKVLIDAIVIRAAEDYRIGKKGLKRKNLTEVQMMYYMRLADDAERFFRSQWFYLMGGTEDMWNQLRRECNRGNYSRSMIRRE